MPISEKVMELFMLKEVLIQDSRSIPVDNINNNIRRSSSGEASFIYQNEDQSEQSLEKEYFRVAKNKLDIVSLNLITLIVD